jgi:hypothetical protein
MVVRLVNWEAIALPRGLREPDSDGVAWMMARLPRGLIIHPSHQFQIVPLKGEILGGFYSRWVTGQTFHIRLLEF